MTTTERTTTTTERTITTTERAITATTAAGAAAAAAALLLSGCASGDGHAGTVSQSWTGISPTGSSLDVGTIVAGIVTDTGDRQGLTVLPATAGNTATADCAGDTVTLTVDDWTITATRGSQILTAADPTRGYDTADIDTTTRRVPGLGESITWHDGDGARVDITAAAIAPTTWNTHSGTFVVGATVLCPTD